MVSSLIERSRMSKKERRKVIYGWLADNHTITDIEELAKKAIEDGIYSYKTAFTDVMHSIQKYQNGDLGRKF